MARFNTRTLTPQTFSPVTSERTPSGQTYNLAPGFARDARSELFLLAVSNMVGESTFYERAQDRDNRYCSLIRQLAVTEGDAEWVAEFLVWLRTEANMRSASLVGAAEYAHARRAAKLPGVRHVVDSVLQRADEPGEFIAYWFTQFGKNTFSGGVKRGVADAMLRLGNEYNYLRYGTSDSRALKWRDVLNLTHPGDKKGSRQHYTADWQRTLFEYIVNSSYDSELVIPEILTRVRARKRLSALTPDERHAFMRRVQSGDQPAREEFYLAMASQWEWAKSWLGA